MRVRLFAALLVAGGAHAQEPKAPAKPVVGTWEVKYTDDSTMKLTLLEETISLLTLMVILEQITDAVQRFAEGTVTGVRLRKVQCGLVDIEVGPEVALRFRPTCRTKAEQIQSIRLGGHAC